MTSAIDTNKLILLPPRNLVILSVILPAIVRTAAIHTLYIPDWSLNSTSYTLSAKQCTTSISIPCLPSRDQSPLLPHASAMSDLFFAASFQKRSKSCTTSTERLSESVRTNYLSPLHRLGEISTAIVKATKVCRKTRSFMDSHRKGCTTSSALRVTPITLACADCWHMPSPKRR